MICAWGQSWERGSRRRGIDEDDDVDMEANAEKNDTETVDGRLVHAPGEEEKTRGVGEEVLVTEVAGRLPHAVERTRGVPEEEEEEAPADCKEVPHWFNFFTTPLGQNNLIKRISGADVSSKSAKFHFLCLQN